MIQPTQNDSAERTQNREQISLPFYIALYIASLVVFTGVGFWFYNHQADQFRAEKSSDLDSIAILKINQIENWITERIEDARVNSTSPFFSQAISTWLADPQNTDLRKELITRLQNILISHQYFNVLLSDENGKILLSLDERLKKLNIEALHVVRLAAADNQIHFGELARSPLDGRIEINVAAPVQIKDKKSQVILLLQIDAAKTLFPILQSWPLPSKSAETLLVRRAGNSVLYLNPLRFRPDPPLTLSVPLTNTLLPSVQASLGKTGVLEGKDYRGVEILAVIQTVPGTNWFLETKVDKEEWYSGLRQSMIEIGGITFLFLLLATIIFRYTFVFQERNLYFHLSQAQQEKLAAQEETRTTLYSIGDGVITTDAKGLVTRLNPVAEKLTGWSESEAIGKPLTEIFHIINEETHQKMTSPVERILKEKRVIGLANHTLLIDRQGRARPIADSSAPIYNSKGMISGIVIVFRDQTEERAIQSELTLLNYVISNSLNEIYLFDAETLQFRFANSGALHNLGYSLEELRQKTPVDIKPEFTPQSFRTFIQPLLDHEQKLMVFETRHLRRDGSDYPVEVFLQLFEYNDQRVFLAVINDISERKQIEQELKQNHDRLITAQAVAHVGNWELDLPSKQVWASEEAFRIYGIPYTDNSPYLTLAEIQQIPLPEERLRFDEALKRLLEEEENYDVKFQIRRPADGAIRVIHSVAKLVRDKDNKPSKVTGIIHDITEMEQAEKKLIESESRYRALFENNHVVMLLIDPENGQILDANQAAANFYGWSRPELMQMKIYQINTLSPSEIQTEMELARQEKRNYFLFKHRKANGSICDVEVFSSPIRLSAKTVLYSIVHDITARREAEISLAQKIDELQRWYEITLHREERILELKQEVNALLQKLGLPPHYTLENEADQHG